MANDAMPEGGLPFDPFGSLPVTETVKLVDVVCAGSGLTVLVGGVVSISHEVDSEPVPGLPSWSVDAGGVDGQRVVPFGGGQAGQAADLVGRARDQGDA